MRRIVVYFSYTGHTKKIADMIAERLDCDILKLKPLVPYSNDYDLAGLCGCMGFRRL